MKLTRIALIGTVNFNVITLRKNVFEVSTIEIDSTTIGFKGQISNVLFSLIASIDF